MKVKNMTYISVLCQLKQQRYLKIEDPPSFLKDRGRFVNAAVT